MRMNTVFSHVIGVVGLALRGYNVGADVRAMISILYELLMVENDSPNIFCYCT